MSAPKLVSLVCTNCGAQLPPRPAGHGEYRCEYCGHGYEVMPEPPPPPPPPQMIPQVRVVVQRPARNPGAGIAALVRTMVVLGLIGAAAFFAIRKHAVPGVGTAAPGQAKGSPVATLPGERLLWDDVGGPPQIAKLPDESEAFLGRYRIGVGDQLFFILADANTMKERWRVGPLGSYGEAYRATHAAVVGAHVVVTDFKTNVHVVDIGTGKEEHAIKLTDRAKGLCAVPGAAQAWVQVEDGQNVLVDVATGAKKSAPRPAACPERSPAFQRAFEAARGAGGKGPTVPGFRANHLFVDGASAVAEGVKSPGTAIPLLVGFDPASHAVKWQQPLEPGDTDSMHPSSHVASGLAGGRFVSTYELPSKPPRIAAFDARTGERAWDLDLPHQKIGSVEDLVVSPAHVYVVRSSNVEVLDAKTGKLEGRVGSAWLDD